jgi:hypothetical protein
MIITVVVIRLPDDGGYPGRGDYLDRAVRPKFANAVPREMNGC